MMRVINYSSLWDFARWFRFAAGILMLGGAIFYWQFLPVVIGGIFFFQAITNTGCCNGATCEFPSSTKTKNNKN